MTKVLVCGGRNYSDWTQLCEHLDALHEQYGFTKIIHGAAPGADTLAGTWARSRGIPIREFPALWQTEGRAAGPRRNQRMLDEGKPDLVVAFAGGKGTANMVSKAIQAMLPVITVAKC